MHKQKESGRQTLEPLERSECGHVASGRRVDVVLKELALSRDDELYDLAEAARVQLVEASDLALVHVQAALRHPANSPLRLSALTFMHVTQCIYGKRMQKSLAEYGEVKSF